MNFSFTPSEQEKFENLGINAIVLFGSHAQHVSQETSDVDVFVIGRRSEEAYDYLYERLSEKIKKLVDIDIVFQSSASMELQNHVAIYGQVLYQGKPDTFVDFREDVMLRYADFAPYRQMFQQATLDRIVP